MTLHAIALREAERFNPHGQHAVTAVEIDGNPADGLGVARVTVVSRVLPVAEFVDIEITSVSL